MASCSAATASSPGAKTQRECYLNTLTMIDHLGQFVQEHIERKGAAIFGGAALPARENRKDIALELLPFVRGRVSQQKRMIGSWTDSTDVLRFVNSKDGAALAHLGTSCPDHFIRTKIRPLFVPAAAGDDVAALQKKVEAALETYRVEYAAYYDKHKVATSPALRDPNPAVVLIPGIGMFSFGKSKTESRIVGRVLHQRHSRDGGGQRCSPEQPSSRMCRRPEPLLPARPSRSTPTMWRCPPREAFRIEYWLLEDAKIRRQPPEKELSRRIALIVGGASGIGRATALLRLSTERT